MIYDAEYISYIRNGESVAVFITRDLVKDINTKGKWIDVFASKGAELGGGRWNFKWFSVELFPRKTNPVYPKDASLEERRYITWQTAHTDIDRLRRSGYKGIKVKIFPKLVNLNKGKYEIRKAVWNKTFNRWVPEKWFTSSCVWRDRKVAVKPKWEYKILKIQRL